MTAFSPFRAAISHEIWDQKYRLKMQGGHLVESAVEDTFWRVARAAAAVEKGGKRKQQAWAGRFYQAMADFGFLPAGRILAGAGTGRAVTLFNCFVMDRIEDDLGAIFDGVKAAALTMQQGGGVGMDFSTLRPRGAPVVSIAADASGPVAFMDVWDSMCRTIMSAGARRGAMMATMRCDHPDIEEFIDAKSKAGRLVNFNTSVLVTDAFVDAVRRDAEWNLTFSGKTVRTLQARVLWETIMRATYERAEPGVIFIDRVNRMNNLAYCETIPATNPCGEQPLPHNGACLLGSINLAALVEGAFTDAACIRTAELEARVATAVRFLDDIIDVSRFPLPSQRAEALSKRRMGLGITGLADALIFCGLRYGSPNAARQAGQWMSTVQRAAYQASAELAAEKGSFPLFCGDELLRSPNIARLPEDTRNAIRKSGLRNGCLTSIAPTGTISLLAGNVSSGAEPVFDFTYSRRIVDRNGQTREEAIEDYAFALWKQQQGDQAPLPDSFVRASDLTTSDHLAMLAALQPHVDSSISKTVNIPRDMPFAAFQEVYLEADRLGLKGLTTFRPNAITGAVLETTLAGPPGSSGSEVRLPVSGLQAPTSAATGKQSEIVYLAPPLERDGVLAGFTYKLKWPSSDHAIYVTINDIERDGRRRPFEIFINTRNLEHYAWTVALTRMISAVFRRGGDVSFVAEELKAVFDPQGGQWLDGRYVPSLLAAIGEVIETHMIGIGFLPPTVKKAGALTGKIRSVGEPPPPVCPRCSSPALTMQEGCKTCLACGYSKCG